MMPPIAPIGLDYLADSLIAQEHDPTLLDFCISNPDPRLVAEMVNRAAPEVVGFTVRNTDDCYFTSQSFFLPEIREMIQLVRDCTNVPTVLGGVGYSIAPEAILNFCGADFGIAGA
ncbi:MAG: cobalamin-dependent protein, partial [bacterium]